MLTINLNKNLEDEAVVVTDIEGVAKTLAIFLSSVAVIKVFLEVGKWMKRKRLARMKQKTEMMDLLRSLCKGQQELSNDQASIGLRLDNMDKERQSVRTEDAGLRANLYLGQIAMIGAVRELAKHMGIEINGEVKKYYEINCNALRTGVGMAPIHATKESEEK